MARRRAEAASACLLVIAFAVLLAARAPAPVDYVPRSVPGLDNAAPQIDALIALDPQRYFDAETALGPVSMLVRAPFAALAPAGDQLARYRLGCFPCLLAFGLVMLRVAVILRRRGSPLWHCALVMGIAAGAPTQAAVAGGHPEEILTSALLIAGVLLAASGSRTTAGAALGLSVATKPWGLIGLPVVASVGPGRATRAVAAVVVAGVLLLPPVLAAPSGVDKGIRAVGVGVIQAPSVWWPLFRRTVRVSDGVRMVEVERPLLPALLNRMVRPALAVALVAALALVAVRRPFTDLETAFLLLATVFLARCVFDPSDASYYHLPFVASVAAWEGLRRRPPLIALLASVALSMTVLKPLHTHPAVICALYLAWALPVLGYLGWSARLRLRVCQAVPSTT